MRTRLLFLFLALASSVLALDQARFDKAKRFFQKRQLTEAKDIIDQLIATEPKNPELHYWAGLIALGQNQPDTAITALEKATTLDATKPPYFHQLGDAYGLAAQKASMFSKLGLAKKCITAYDRAVALAPDMIEYRKSRYEYYRAAPSMAGGGMDKALAELTVIDKLDPIQGAGLRADLKLKEKKPEEAFALLTALREKFPDNKVLHYQLGRLSAMTDLHLDEGEAALKDYIAYTPKAGEPALWAAHWRLAQILEKRNAIAEACAQYEETLKLNPSFSRARDALKRLQTPPASSS